VRGAEMTASRLRLFRSPRGRTDGGV